MSTKLANILTIIFFPGLMPTYLVAILYFVSPYVLSVQSYLWPAKLLFLFFILLYTFLIPSLLIVWLYKRNKIEHIQLKNLKDRRIPYLANIVCSAFLVYFFYQKSILLQPTAILIFFSTATILVVAFISLWWQVSAHAAGGAGLLGALFALNVKYDVSSLQIPCYATLLITGLIISARLRLNAHTPAQVFVGLCIGLFFSILSSFFI